MRCIIAGGRDFKPTEEHKSWVIDKIHKHGITEIVSGGARGADYFGEKVGKECNLKITVFNAEWNRYGRSAGPRRNKEMAIYADACILFPGGRGTLSMEREAKKRDLVLLKYNQ